MTKTNDVVIGALNVSLKLLTKQEWLYMLNPHESNLNDCEYCGEHYVYIDEEGLCPDCQRIKENFLKAYCDYLFYKQTLEVKLNARHNL